MNGHKRRLFAEKMNLFPEVIWDRCSLRHGVAWAFGWIDRPDGLSDFMLLEAESKEWEEGIRAGCSTSSALYSADFSRRLNGPDAEHFDCERVEHVFGDLIDRKLELAR